MKNSDHNRPPPSQSARPRSDSGASFIELLVSIVLLGTAGLAVLTALAASIRSSSVHDRVATAQAQLSDAGDILTDVVFEGALPGDPHYDDCATPAAYNARLAGDWPAQAASWANVSVVDVRFWNGTTWDSSCVSGGLQRITLEASIGDLTRRLDVVKRQATQAVGASGGAWDDDMVAPDQNPGFP